MLVTGLAFAPAASAAVAPSSSTSNTPSSSTTLDQGQIVGDVPAFDTPGTRQQMVFAFRALAGTHGVSVAVNRKSIKIRGTVDGTTSTVDGVPSTGGTSAVRSTVMLLLDTSGSMTSRISGPGTTSTTTRFDAELQAARDFVRQVRGSGTSVGIVTFGDPAFEALPPTPNMDDVEKVIDGLDAKDLSDYTAMFDAVVVGANAMKNTPGIHRLLMISDGSDTSRKAKTTLPGAKKALVPDRKNVVTEIDFTGVLVGREPGSSITDIADQRNVIKFGDAGLSRRLKALIASQVQDQQRIVDLTADVPPAWRGKDVELSVTGTTADGASVSGYSFPWSFPSAAAPLVTLGSSVPVLAVQEPRGIAPPWPVVVAALIAFFIALAVLINSAVGGLTGVDDEKSAVVRRIEVYTVNSGAPTRVSVTEQTTRLGDSALTRSAVGLMTKVARSSQLDSALDAQLEAAGLPLRTAEWMLLHIGIAVGAAVLLWAIAGGQLAAMVVGLLLGLAGPWIFLTLAKARRRSHFLAQLPDTLQLLAGSLAAGYSLPQAMDAVVRETAPPISLEFNRALVEARLGMPPEDALDGIARRTGSQDFSWIVMAIRIQRDVGGNLAELLSSVAGTLRERERLRRQVSALSAEGRLSGAILGALPLVFGLYLMLTRPDYIAPLFNTQMGLLFLVIGGVTLAIGLFWMSRLIKVEV